MLIKNVQNDQSIFASHRGEKKTVLAYLLATLCFDICYHHVMILERSQNIFILGLTQVCDMYNSLEHLNTKKKG